MPTVYTHAMVGVSLAYIGLGRRKGWVYWLSAALLPVIPDLDTLSVTSNNSIWGHRGFTHSLAFAVGLGLAATMLAGWYLRLGFWRSAALFSAIAASHALLDLFTTAGNGIALWWPMSDARAGPLGPIPVADLGFDWPNPMRSPAIRKELLWVWLPLAAAVFVIMLWRRALIQRYVWPRGR
jgi:inner membrane protein